jgi:hypothetical protein
MYLVTPRSSHIKGRLHLRNDYFVLLKVYQLRVRNSTAGFFLYQKSLYSVTLAGFLSLNAKCVEILRHLLA